MSPLSSKHTSMSKPGVCLALKHEFLIACANALRSNFPTFSVTAFTTYMPV